MGRGKSTLLAQAAIRMADPERFHVDRRIPVITNFKEIRDRWKGDLGSLLEEVRASVSMDGLKYVVFIDGLDELKMDPAEQIDLLSAIKASLNGRPEVNLVIASRPVAIEVDQHVEGAFTKLELEPFSTKQVIKLVDSLCKSKLILARLTKDLEKSSLFRSLPKSPISAILLATLLRENSNEIPSTMTELYRKYVEHVLGRWDMSKGLQSQTEYEVINNVSISLARFYIDNSLDVFSIQEARDVFNAYVGSRNLGPFDPGKCFDKLLEKNEIFAVSQHDGVMTFRHRTFAEYLYALGRHLDNDNELQPEIFHSYWTNVYFFFFGIKKDASTLVAAASAMNGEGQMGRFNKMLAMPNFLLAAYMTPYADVTFAVRRYFDEVAALYLGIVSKQDDENPLSKLPEIDLLCIFTITISRYFSYDFFIDALKTCAADLYSQPTLDQTSDLTELFFLNSALASIGDHHAYETLIEDYGSIMPVALRLGIVNHSEFVGLKTEAVERYSKKFHKALRNNPSLARSVKQIFEPPTKAVGREKQLVGSSNPRNPRKPA